MAITRHSRYPYQPASSQRLRSGKVVVKAAASQSARSSSVRVQKHSPSLRSQKSDSKNRLRSSKQRHVKAGIQGSGNAAEPEMSNVPQPKAVSPSARSSPLSTPPGSAMSETGTLTQHMEEKMDLTPPTPTSTASEIQDLSIDLEDVGLPVDGL
jgi:hypothetical protein